MVSTEKELLYITASHRVLAEQMAGVSDVAKSISIGSLACAEAVVLGDDKAMNIAHTAIEEHALAADERLRVWAMLYSQGVPAALPEARRNAGINGKPPKSAAEYKRGHVPDYAYVKRVVDVASVGDAECVPLARSLAQRALPSKQTELFSQLYRAGDELSFEWAINSARMQKNFNEAVGETNNLNTDIALSDMGIRAVGAGDTQKVQRILKFIDDPALSAKLWAAAYKNGIFDSETDITGLLMPDAIRQSIGQDLLRHRAASGSRQALKLLKKQSLPFRTQRFNTTDEYESDLKNLLVLHDARNPKAARRLKNLVEAHEAPDKYLPYLGAVGLQSSQLALAESLYQKSHERVIKEASSDPQYLLNLKRRRIEAAENVMHAVFTLDNWQRAFDLRMDNPEPNPINASHLVNLLADYISPRVSATY